MRFAKKPQKNRVFFRLLSVCGDYVDRDLYYKEARRQLAFSDPTYWAENHVVSY